MSFHSYDPWKRLLDVVLSSVALIASAPVQALIAIVVRLNLGPPVLFRQIRSGKEGVAFELVKFRTMLDVDLALGLVTDEERMTSIGGFLRSTSLDELPTLWNVICGQMSLVGPRPLLARYLNRYSPHQMRRHETRPGMTGLAQISGRNALSWEKRLDLDVEYVDQRSFSLDLSIMISTIGHVLRRSGISAGGEATMSEFFGDSVSHFGPVIDKPN